MHSKRLQSFKSRYRLNKHYIFLNHQEKQHFYKLDNKLIDKSRAPPGPGETLGAVQIEPEIKD